VFLSLGACVVAVEPHEPCRRVLRDRFGGRVALVEAALGPAEGEAELLVASYHTLSSLSPEWTEAVRASGRFAEFDWDRRERVRVTTLDALIGEHGVPDFCKIDVEGYELEVLRGLSRPLPALSFEFDVERLDSRLQAVDHLAALGMTQFNFSFGESLRLALEPWTDVDGIRRFLTSPLHTTATFGDVYALSG
jgi:FkbM family methyltransferase